MSTYTVNKEKFVCEDVVALYNGIVWDANKTPTTVDSVIAAAEAAEKALKADPSAENISAAEKAVAAIDEMLKNNSLSKTEKDALNAAKKSLGDLIDLSRCQKRRSGWL